jgi:hypothetical protein
MEAEVIKLVLEITIVAVLFVWLIKNSLGV